MPTVQQSQSTIGRAWQRVRCSRRRVIGAALAAVVIALLTAACAPPPETFIDAVDPSASPTNQTSITFSYSGSSEAAIDHFECSLDGAPFSPCPSDSPVSGSITYTGLADGTHTFQVRAHDVFGTSDPSPASYSWTIDATGPALTVPAPITVNATSLNGAVVDYQGMVSATDPSGVASISCDPPSGSVFPNGRTTVTCVAVDTLGNQTTRTFEVRVISLVEQTAALRTQVNAWPASSLKSGVQLSLNRVEMALRNGNATGACTNLRDAVRQVQRSSRVLTAAQKDAFLADAERLRVNIGC